MKRRILKYLKGRLLLFLIGLGLTLLGVTMALMTILGWFVIYCGIYVMLLAMLLALFGLDN